MIEKIEQLNEPLWIQEVLWKCIDSDSKNSKFGVCDSNNNLILPLVYDEIKVVEFGQIAAKNDNKWEYFETSFKNNVLKVKKLNVLYADTKGNVIKEI